MKKTIKIVLISLGSLIALLLAFLLFLIINGSCNLNYDDETEKFPNWMNEIKDETYLHNIAIPGSHDAGTSGMNWLGETQQYSIKEQLELGVRYFDLRVNDNNGKLVIYHSIINGQEFIPILEDIKEFIKNHPSEVLLLDFQHFKNGSEDEVYELVTTYLYNDNLLVVNEKNISDLEFITTLRLKEARGKCIVFWGDRSNDLSNYVFLRNNDTGTNKEMALDSYYFDTYHKKDVDVLIKQFPKYFEKISDKVDNELRGIFVLQAQLTDGALIFGPWSKEKVNCDDISEYIKELVESKYLDSVNVIMRDFITGKKAGEIIRLNYYKGISKE